MSQDVNHTSAGSADHPNVAVVNAMTAAIVAQDLGALAKTLTEDFTLHVRGFVPPAGDHRGAEGLLGAIGSLFEITDGDIDLDQLFCIGADHWVVEWEHATLGRNGKRMESMNAFVYRLEDGRIADMWMYWGVPPEPAEDFFAQ